jgi:Putative zinc-finger
MATYEKVMRTVDPIERRFDPPQMVVLLKLACRRRLIDGRRHKMVITEVALENAGDMADPTASAPEDVVQDREAAAVGREAIYSLSPRDREIFRLRHGLGLTPSEIQRRIPGLNRRIYRRSIGRANAGVRAAFEQIETGRRCIVVQLVLPFYMANGLSHELAQVVEAHLQHCSACRREKANTLRRGARSRGRGGPRPESPGTLVRAA